MTAIKIKPGDRVMCTDTKSSMFWKTGKVDHISEKGGYWVLLDEDAGSGTLSLIRGPLEPTLVPFGQAPSNVPEMPKEAPNTAVWAETGAFIVAMVLLILATWACILHKESTGGVLMIWCVVVAIVALVIGIFNGRYDAEK